MDITRIVALDGAPALAELLRVNREFLAPWSPVRSDRYFTADGQVAWVSGRRRTCPNPPARSVKSPMALHGADAERRRAVDQNWTGPVTRSRAASQGKNVEMKEAEKEKEASSSDEEAPAAAGTVVITREEFFELLLQYFRNNEERVHAAYRSGSGWELWLHVELYMYITGADAEYDITRETVYEGKRLRADFDLNKNRPRGRMRVEFKMQTAKELAGALWKRIGDDFNKLSDIGIKGSTIQVVVCFLGGDIENLLASEVGAKIIWKGRHGLRVVTLERG